MTIFAMSIRYLRNHLLKRLEKEEPWVKESDIKYILTVPAIWKENAKQFMREAAVEVIDLHVYKIKRRDRKRSNADFFIFLSNVLLRVPKQFKTLKKHL
jgi:hypothetical protein